jgi:hypothetical protein
MRAMRFPDPIRPPAHRLARLRRPLPGVRACGLRRVDAGPRVLAIEELTVAKTKASKKAPKAEKPKAPAPAMPKIKKIEPK